jgi:hypothetical protein
VKQSYSHGRYPSTFGNIIFIETKYYDENFSLREMTIGTSFTVYNYNSKMLNIILDRAPPGYAETTVITTTETIVSIPPAKIVNDFTVPEAAVFTYLTYWDVRYLVIIPAGSSV